MNLDIVDTITLASVLVTVAFLVRTIYEARREKNEQKNIILKREEDLSDYDKILRSTYGLENAREKNTGTHFEDETIYLNRAKAIRNESALFTWINEC